MKRILSGVQATGKMHIGNYLGALKPWAALQGQGETFYFIPDLHTLNLRPDPKELRQATFSTVAWLLAVGIDPEQSVIFQQSRVPAHAELAIILDNYVTMGELQRMTQYKDKSAKRGAEGQVAGLFTYPVLMAADILLYDTNIVPVGDDQRQHVELARDIATRINNLYGEVFIVPEPQIEKVGARVMSLQDPSTKMSKSDPDQSGCLLLLDDAETIKTKIKRAVTDSGSAIEASDDKPALTNLLQIYAAITDRPITDIVTDYTGSSYGEFKTSLSEIIIEALLPVQSRYQQLIANENHLTDILEQGSHKANMLAEQKLAKIQAIIGLR